MASEFLVRIDSRECAVKNILPEKLDKDGIRYVFENLDSGDFTLEAEGQPLWVIERKTIKDLLASIKDGRYLCQKQKMIEKFGREHIMYVIEGSFTFSACTPSLNETEYKSVMSSIINTQLRDKIIVMRTQDVMDTCCLIYNIVARASKDINKYIARGTTEHNVETSTRQASYQHTSRKEHFTKTDVFTQQLCQISGISQKTAEALGKEFNDMKTFYDNLTPLEDEEKLKILKNIYLKDNRRINSKVAVKILQYMF